MKIWLSPVVVFVSMAVPITLLSLLIYVAAQQSFRQNLNDPQIVMAEDGAAKLAAGELPASLFDRSASLIDMNESLAPWLAVYDQHGVVLEASGQLDNRPPQLPAGLFDQSTWSAKKTFDSRAGPETRVTWQPTAGVRQAVVLVHLPDGRFVAAGRNMREIEGRIGDVGWLIMEGWIVTLVLTLCATIIGWRLPMTLRN